MGVTGYVETMGLDRGNNDASGRPGWAPSFAPRAQSLDYITKLATVAFLVLGAAYFVGLSPLKPFAPRIAPGIK